MKIKSAKMVTACCLFPVEFGVEILHEGECAGNRYLTLLLNYADGRPPELLRIEFEDAFEGQTAQSSTESLTVQTASSRAGLGECPGKRGK